ncbi:hypothetical protein L8R84_05905 [Vibrio splendidus]|uniref:hypothetical protein n=1 Tax=Vibrio splendidus TaxID=29497 RepID=UPI002469080C|nr:hypothetical protein [Vibrio splendidus]MDH5935675.1 hypothetical protein [Vibrio splendidus]
MTNRNADWVRFFKLEEQFFDDVISSSSEVESFGSHCYPKYSEEFTESGHLRLTKPQHIRWIGHVNGDLNLFNKLQKQAEEIYDLHQSLTLSEKRCSREPIFLSDATRIGVYKNVAHSSNLITSSDEVSLVRGKYTDTAADDIQKYNEMREELIRLGFSTAIVSLAPVTLSLKVSTKELVNHFGREDIVYRRQTGHQYRSRVYSDRQSKPMKLGFFISLNPITYHSVVSPRESREDSYLNSGQAIPFVGPCDGEFWISKTS